MGLKDKLSKAKETEWLVENKSVAEIKTLVDLAKISASIEAKRIEMNMTQAQFAKYMNVSQGMISKWESREYNFTIKALNEICEKLDLAFEANLEQKSGASELYEFKPMKKSVFKPRFSYEEEEALA